MTGQRSPVVIDALSKPVIQRHMRLRRDAVRDRWVVLAPERIFEPNATAVAVLQLCDGMRTVEAIAAELSRSFSAEHTQILDDIIPMLQDLADRGVIAGSARGA
jgi:pyrroloquinoline quinone biosynthesis protein D